MCAQAALSCIIGVSCIIPYLNCLSSDIHMFDKHSMHLVIMPLQKQHNWVVGVVMAPTQHGDNLISVKHTGLIL